MQEVEARLQESAAELALRKGEAPESVKNLVKRGQRKSRKKVDSHRMAASGDSDRMAEDDDASAYVEALGNKMLCMSWRASIFMCRGLIAVQEGLFTGPSAKHLRTRRWQQWGCGKTDRFWVPQFLVWLLSNAIV